MPWGKRRKGKQSSTRGGGGGGSNTSNTSAASSAAPNPAPAAGSGTVTAVSTTGDNSKQDNKSESSKGNTSNNDNNNKEEMTATTTNTNTSKGSHQQHYQQIEQQKEDLRLVLTSEKRRGIYECDFCHSDISQLPRIRCAVCPDFDLCLDCFATTDHSSAIARLKAAATAHSELKNDGITAGLAPGVSTAAVNHDNSHGYRVCDNTRYPVFASNRIVVPPSSSSRSQGGSANEANAGSTKDNKDKGDAMDVDSDNDGKKKGASTDSSSLDDAVTADGDGASTATSDIIVVSDDPKSIWTAEEDLRLLDAILTHGLGNWVDIAEAVGGNGSVGKTPKRCMERYFDDFLGRYGHILPTHTLIEIDDDDENDSKSNSNNDPTSTNTGTGNNSKAEEDDSLRASKRRTAFSARSSSNITSSSAGGRPRKRYKVVPTESLPGYDDVWPDPYVPPTKGVKAGQEVSRDLACKAELAFVKATTSAPTKEEADKIRKEWMETRLQQLGAPTVLPPRPEDTMTLPGAELAGFMPRRGDFDIEWENDAESALADMEFSQGDLPQDRKLKLQVLEIYSQKLDEREKRKKFILSRKLYDYRNNLKKEQEMPTDERDLVRRMRLFERFHTPEEHKIFIADILKAKRLRKEIAKLQMYRRIGVRSLAEAEKYELDKSRRQFHKVSQLQKEAEGSNSKSQSATSGGTGGTGESTTTGGAAQGMDSSTDSLWKQYRTNDRKVRRSINRSGSSMSEHSLDPRNIEEKKELSNASRSEEDKKNEEETKTQKGQVDGSDTTDTPAKVKDEKGDNQTSADDKMDVDGEDKNDNSQQNDKDVDNKDKKTEEVGFDISKCSGYDLLSKKEIALCIKLRLYPNQYLEIKKALIHESLTKGLLDKEGPGSGRGVIVKMDVERRGDIVDFMLRAGWVSNKLAMAARNVTPPRSVVE